MDKNDRKLLKEIITEYNDEKHEDYYDLLRHVIYTYSRAFFTFGPNHKITKEVKEIWREFKNNHNVVLDYQQLLLKNYKLMHYCEALDFLDLIQDYDDESFKYYLESFGDIIDACDTNVEFRANHRKKHFKPLEQDEMINIAYKGLTVNRDDIKKFLGYPQEFWDYLKPRMREVDPWIVENRIFYVTLLRYDKDILKDMLVVVPGIVNTFTACVNVHEFKHAYDMYKQIGQVVDDKDPMYEKAASEMEKIFKYEYLLKKKF